MAKSDFKLPLILKLGNITLYYRWDSTKLIGRAKGGPSKDQIMNDPKCAGTKREGIHFGGCSTTAKLIRDAMFNVTHLTDMAVHSRLQKVLRGIIKLEKPTDPTKLNSIIFANRLHLIEGFSLRDKHTFDSVLAAPVTSILNRSDHSAIVQIPPLTQGINFRPPWPQPYFRFRLSLGVIRDMHYVPGIGYEPITKGGLEYTDTLDMDWLNTNNNYPGRQVQLKLDNPAFDSNCHLMLSIGIEFGAKTGETIASVPKTGCAKILAVG